jgi:hypothetical protein
VHEQHQERYFQPRSTPAWENEPEKPVGRTSQKRKKRVAVMLKTNVRLTVNVYQQVSYTKQKSRQVTAKKRRSTLE